MNAHWGGNRAGQARTQYGIINTWLCSSILTACANYESSKLKPATFVLAPNMADVLRLSTEICPVFTSHKRQAPQATMDGTVDSTVDTTIDGTDSTVDNTVDSTVDNDLAT